MSNICNNFSLIGIVEKQIDFKASGNTLIAKYLVVTKSGNSNYYLQITAFNAVAKKSSIICKRGCIVTCSGTIKGGLSGENIQLICDDIELLHQPVKKNVTDREYQTLIKMFQPNLKETDTIRCVSKKFKKGYYQR